MLQRPDHPFLPAAGWLALVLLCASCGLDTGGILIGYDGSSPESDFTGSDWRVDVVDASDGLPDGGELTDPPLPDLADAADREPAPTCADMGAGYCDDGVECTGDRCVDTETGPRCDHPVVDEFCLIDGICYPARVSHSDNACMACRPTVSDTSWSPRNDKALCEGGMCCGGLCRPDATCCANEDCRGCSGPAADCGSLGDGECELEEGCSLVPDGSCGGRSPCNTWNTNRTRCEACGCFWEGEGDCDPSGEDICEDQHGEGACAAQAPCGCTWISSGDDRCDGTYFPCAGIPDEATCMLEGTCSWNPSAICDPTTFTCR